MGTDLLAFRFCVGILRFYVVKSSDSFMQVCKDVKRQSAPLSRSVLCFFKESHFITIVLIKSEGLPLSLDTNMLAFLFLCKNPAAFVSKVLGFLLWLSAKKLKRQFVSRARSAPQIFYKNNCNKMRFLEKPKDGAGMSGSIQFPAPLNFSN